MVTVNVRVPYLASWTTRYVVEGRVIDVEHVWTTATNWGHGPEATEEGWKTRRIGPFVVAERVQL